MADWAVACVCEATIRVQEDQVVVCGIDHNRLISYVLRDRLDFRDSAHTSTSTQPPRVNMKNAR